MQSLRRNKLVLKILLATAGVAAGILLLVTVWQIRAWMMPSGRRISEKDYALLKLKLDYIPFLDAKNAFIQDAKNAESFYISGDLHFSPKGHRKLAEYIWPWLENLAQSPR